LLTNDGIIKVCRASLKNSYRDISVLGKTSSDDTAGCLRKWSDIIAAI
jgi:hypothetical protein